MRRQVTDDHVIAAIAGGQGGVIGRAQLLALGLTPAAIDHRVRTGRLHLVCRGAYTVGHAVIGPVGRRWVAVLRCGECAALSDASAADAWGLRPSAAARMHVTVPAHVRLRPSGLVVHRRTLAPDEVTELDGLPITTPQRTLLDLAAAGIRRRQLEAALNHAEKALRIDWGVMLRLLARHRGRPGVPLLEATLSRYAAGAHDTRSVLEDIVLALCRDAGFPLPQSNVVVEGKVRDFYWPHAGLVVEADSYRWHHSPSALDDDRERDVELTLAGVRFLRFTYDQCTERRGYVRRAIHAALLTRAGARRRAA